MTANNWPEMERKGENNPAVLCLSLELSLLPGLGEGDLSWRQAEVVQVTLSGTCSSRGLLTASSRLYYSNCNYYNLRIHSDPVTHAHSISKKKAKPMQSVLGKH